MKFERIDDKTVKCFLSNEELEEYDIDYKDFLTRSDKAREVVHDIIQQATQEVGYRPPKYAFDLQIMVIPEQGLLLTFSERDPLENTEGGNKLMEYLREVKRALELSYGEKNKDNAEDEQKKPDKVVFVFEQLGSVLSLAKAVPAKLRVRSALYEMDGRYYLYLQKGKASYEKYSKLCIQAMEFGEIYGASAQSILFVEEHGKCLIDKHALRKLKL